MSELKTDKPLFLNFTQAALGFEKRADGKVYVDIWIDEHRSIPVGRLDPTEVKNVIGWLEAQ